MNRTIQQYFQDFHIEGERDNICSYDSLSILNRVGNMNALIRTVCGWNFPNKLTSTSNQVVVTFYSDSTKTLSGFNITYDVHEPIRKLRVWNAKTKINIGRWNVNHIAVWKVYRYYNNNKVWYGNRWVNSPLETKLRRSLQN